MPRQKMDLWLNFFSQFPTLTLTKGQTLLDNSEKPKGIYYLVSGNIRQFSTSATGKELTIHIFVPGSIFPLSWVLNNYRDNYSFQSVNDCNLYIAPTNQVEKFMRAHPELAWEVTSRLLRGISGLTKRIESLTFDTASERVTSALIYLANHFAKKDVRGVRLPHFTHESLAHLAGLSRERTSLEIEKMERSGLLIKKSDHSLVIPFMETLKDKSLR